MARKQHVLNTETSAAADAPATRRFGALLVVALALTGLSMRTAVTSVGAVLDDLQAGLHTSSGVSGVITTLPVICFALIGAAAPRLAHRFGAHQLLVGSLATMTVGLLARAVIGQVWAFILLSVLALAGGAVANVLMPSLVKRHFPDRIGEMTALYTTALATGQTLAAGLSVPIGSIGGSWRSGLGSWALLSAVAVLPWLPTLRHDRPTGVVRAGASARELLHSRTAWAVTILFAFQSFQAYVAFGWFAKLLSSDGIGETTAGWMVAVLSAMTIPMSILTPLVPARWHRSVFFGLTACDAAAYIGLWVAPVGGAWLWMVLAGMGLGMFPLVLTLIGLRSRAADTTASLSAFAQSIGYIIAGSGPLLFGIVHGATDGWGVPILLLLVALVIALGSSWFASIPRFVDDEMARLDA